MSAGKDVRMGTLNIDHLRKWISLSAEALEANATLLSDLDAAIGDGDHGANMTRGFAAVSKKLDGNVPSSEIGAMFKTVGMTLLSTVGGAAGPLYGGFFLELGKKTVGCKELDVALLGEVLSAGLADIQKRGKAELGDKTMVDAMAPAIAALKSAGPDVAAATQAAAQAARQAAAATVPMLARKGRASYLGERSIGHQDPGATSTALLFESLATACSAS